MERMRVVSVGEYGCSFDVEKVFESAQRHGVILEVKVGQKIDAGGVLCRLYYTREDNVEEAAQLVEDAFRISGAAPESRELILEVVG